MTPPESERVPPYGIIVMAIILGAMALLALYTSVQKLRRDKIETVIVTPVATPTPSPMAP
jgi:hypothetical protein